MEMNRHKQGILVRQATKDDLQVLLELNQELVHFLSPLTLERMEALYEEAALRYVVEQEGTFAGFLLAFREGAHYDSINYTWFESRYPKFLYVDRIVISPRAKGPGLGSALYDQVFAQAIMEQIPVITAEYYIVPPNLVSEKFHTKFGFHEVGQQKTADGKKTVSLQVAEVCK